MVGVKRARNVEKLLLDVFKNNIPGGLVGVLCVVCSYQGKVIVDFRFVPFDLLILMSFQVA